MAAGAAVVAGLPWRCWHSPPASQPQPPPHPTPPPAVPSTLTLFTRSPPPPPQVVVTKLKLDKDRKALLERKRAGKGLADKGKFSEAEVAAMENVE